VEFFLNIVVTLGTYLWKLVLPIGLNYYHLFEPVRSVSPAVVVSLLALLVLIAAIPLLRKRNGLVSYAIFWTFVPLAPVMNLTGVGENVLAERYLYLPSVGFVWLIGWGWGWLAERWREPSSSQKAALAWMPWAAAGIVLLLGSIMVV